MPRMLSTLIYAFLAPEQPDDCRQASLELLTAALKATGPVVHCGQVVSLGKDGSVDFEPCKSEPIPASTTADDEGNTVEVPAREPTEAEVAEQLGLPLASDTPVPPYDDRKIGLE